MGQAAVTGATMTCPFAAAPVPVPLNVTSNSQVLIDGKPAGTIQDAGAMVNIPSFGMCTTLSNPQVAAATAAALGVLTPQPCVPQTQSFIPTQAKVLVGGKPCLTGDCSVMCMYGGKISIMMPGQAKVMVG